MVRRLVRIVCIAAAVVFSGLASEARAESITLDAESTTSFNVSWSKVVQGTELTALGTFTVTVVGDTASFLITLTNNTDLVTEHVHSLGFNIDPSATGLTDPLQGAVFKNFALSQKFPSYQTIDICSWASNTCSGGAQGNSLAGGGASDTFGFTLHGDFGDGLTLSSFALKFQGDLGSYQLASTPTTVPEYGSSASFLLIGLGFVAAFAARGRGDDAPVPRQL